MPCRRTASQVTVTASAPQRASATATRRVRLSTDSAGTARYLQGWGKVAVGESGAIVQCQVVASTRRRAFLERPGPRRIDDHILLVRLLRLLRGYRRRHGARRPARR